MTKFYVVLISVIRLTLKASINNPKLKNTKYRTLIECDLKPFNPFQWGYQLEGQ